MPFSMRSFISSKGVTSSTSWTPTAPRSGRAPSTKSSSTTHWRKGSCITGERSRTPVSAARRSMSSGLVAGTMRSTMVEGKRALGLDPVGEAGVDQAGELQHDAAHDAAVLGQVVAAEHGERARARRRGGGRARATRKPGAERGASGCARSWTMSGWCAVEPAGRGLVAIALLGDGEADDADARVGHGGEHGGAGPRGRRARPATTSITRGVSPSGPSSSAV